MLRTTERAWWPAVGAPLERRVRLHTPLTIELGRGALKRKLELESARMNFCVMRFGWQVRRCLGLRALELAEVQSCATAESRMDFEISGFGRRHR